MKHEIFWLPASLLVFAGVFYLLPYTSPENAILYRSHGPAAAFAFIIGAVLFFLFLLPDYLTSKKRK